MKKIVLIFLVLLLTACSQRSPTVEGENKRFANKFYPAKIETRYVKGDITAQKYPILFLFGGYEGGWREDEHVQKLQKLGYHVVSITFYDKKGFSNDLANVNIDEIKKIIESYKRYSSVDTNFVGIIGQGKGAELALLMASYYPDIKMVVGMSTPHVSFQSSRATLATEPSWIHRGEEVPYVAYPKLSLTSLKTVFRLMRRKINDYRDIHDVALEDIEAVENARIKVENIDGDIFLVSLQSDGMWNSVFMGKEIMKRLKEKSFKHRYAHKSYKGNWFLSREKSEEKKAWSDIYRFITTSFKVPYTKNIFSTIDINRDNGISLEEFMSFTEKEEEKNRRTSMSRMFLRCDTNHDYQIDFSEARMPIIYKSDSYYSSDIPNPNYIPLPPVNYACMISQNNFKEYDVDSDNLVTFNEFSKHLEDGIKSNDDIISANRLEVYKNNSANDRFKQCDKNSDSKIDRKEAMLEICHIDKFVFAIADKNKNGSIALDELVALPAKYAQYRHPFELPYRENEIVCIESYTPETTELYELLFNSLNECDKNHDAKLDTLEVTAKECGFTEEEFLEADSNRDGHFEYKDIELIDKIKRFNRVDKDGSGKLEFYEWIEVY